MLNEIWDGKNTILASAKKETGTVQNVQNDTPRSDEVLLLRKCLKSTLVFVALRVRQQQGNKCIGRVLRGRSLPVLERSVLATHTILLYYSTLLLYSIRNLSCVVPGRLVSSPRTNRAPRENLSFSPIGSWSLPRHRFDWSNGWKMCQLVWWRNKLVLRTLLGAGHPRFIFSDFERSNFLFLVLFEWLRSAPRSRASLCADLGECLVFESAPPPTV